MSGRANHLLRFLDRWLGIPIALLSAFPRKIHSSSPPDKLEKICVLCQGAIGDLLLLSALTEALRHKFPKLKIDLILSESNSQAASLIPHINSWKAFSIKRPDKIIRQIRKEKYDLLIDSSQWARLGALVSNLSGAKCTVGFKTSGQWRHFGYDIKVLHSCQKHEKDNFLALGKAIWQDLAGECTLQIPSDTKIPLKLQNEKYICLHMWPAGIKSWLKEWPQVYWHELAERLMRSGYRICLTGGPSDRARSEIFAGSFAEAKGKLDILAGRCDLCQTAAILQKAAALVTVNTGIMHLGALLGTLTVALHGPTNPLRWGPLGTNAISLLPKIGQQAYLNLGFEYPENAKNNLNGISVQAVLEALKSLGLS